MFGRLEPLPAGDSIPLLKKRLRVGRRDSCDIVLNFVNLSSHHALLELEEGYWFVRDLRSRNGVKLNGKRILIGIRRRIDPESIIAFASHEYVIRYDPNDLGAYGTPPSDQQLDDFFNTSLLDRGAGPAGMGIRPRNDPKKPPPMGGSANPD